MYQEHYVVEMNESLIQNCIYCGIVINDYRNHIIKKGANRLRGYPSGIVYSKSGNPFITTTLKPNEQIIKCNNRK